MSSKNTHTTKLKAILERKGISQIQLCAQIQKHFKPVRTDAISQIVTGKKANITIFTLVKICSALKVSPNDIIDYEQIETKLRREKKLLTQVPLQKVKPSVKQDKKPPMKKTTQPTKVSSKNFGNKKEDKKSLPKHNESLDVMTQNAHTDILASTLPRKSKLTAPRKKRK